MYINACGETPQKNVVTLAPNTLGRCNAACSKPDESVEVGLMSQSKAHNQEDVTLLSKMAHESTSLPESCLTLSRIARLVANGK